MAFNNLTKDEYHRLISDRLVAIYAMIKDCEVRDDIIKIMGDSIDAHYPNINQQREWLINFLTWHDSENLGCLPKGVEGRVDEYIKLINYGKGNL